MASSLQLIHPQSISKRYHSSIIKSSIQMISSISPSHLTTLTHRTLLTLTIAILEIITVLTALNHLGGLQIFIESLKDESLFAASFCFPLLTGQQIPKITLFPSPPSQTQPKLPPPLPPPPPPQPLPPPPQPPPGPPLSKPLFQEKFQLLSKYFTFITMILFMLIYQNNYQNLLFVYIINISYIIKVFIQIIHGKELFHLRGTNYYCVTNI